MDEKHQLAGESSQERVEGRWLVLAYPANPTIRLDADMLDRILVDDRYIVLSVDDVTVTLEIPRGFETAREIAERLIPYTRSAPITQPEVYEDAIRRQVANGTEGDRSVPALFFGDDAVRAGNEIVHIGDFACLISDVKRYAMVGADLPLPNGNLQAGLALLVVAAKQRREDTRSLSHRIAEYEERTRLDVLDSD